MASSEEAKTNLKEYVNRCRLERGNITHTEIAKRMGTTLQNLSVKYRRNSFRICDLENIADALNADLSIVFIDRETGKPLVPGTSYSEDNPNETVNEATPETPIIHEQTSGGTEDETSQNTTQEPVTEQPTETEPSVETSTVHTEKSDQIAPSFYHNNNN